MQLRHILKIFSLTLSATLVAACSTTDTVATAAVEASAPKPVAPDNVATSSGFIWSPELGLQVIPLPSYATSMHVTDMNNAGQVVGYVNAGGGSENYRAFFWSRTSGFKAIGSLVGPDGISLAGTINDAGEVRGLSEGPSTIWNGPMGVVPQDNFVWTEAGGIRPASGDSQNSGLSSRPRNLVLPSGMDCWNVVGSNAKGQAIGYAGIANTSTTPRSRDSIGECIYKNALAWNADGSFVEIGSCGPRSECAINLSAINNSGEVVGFSFATGSFRWTASKGFVVLPMADAGVDLIADNGDAAGTALIGQVTTPLLWMASGELRTIQLPAGASYGYPVAIKANTQVAGNFR